MEKNIKKGEEMVLFKHTKKSQECDHFQMAKKIHQFHVMTETFFEE